MELYPLKAVFGAAVTLFAAYGLGRAAAGRLRFVQAATSSAEYSLFSLALGAALLSQLTLALGLLGGLYDASFIAIVVLSAGAWFRWGRGGTSGYAAPLSKDEAPWRRMFLATALFYGPLYLLNVLAPETSTDGLGYHLALPARYYREHGIHPVTTSVYGFLSQGAEMLFLFSYAFAREEASKLLHFAFFGATLWAMILLARRLGRPAAGWIGAALYACSPVVGKDAVSAYNDCLLAFYVLLLFHGLVILHESGERRWAGLLGGLAGFCFAVKYTGAYAAVPAGLATVYIAWRSGGARGAIRAAAAFALAAAFFIAPWPAKNWVQSGNPVAPFYNDLFPNPYVSVDWEQGYRDYFKLYRYPDERRGWIDWAELPLEWTVRGHRNGGMAGPLFLAAPLALLAWRVRWVRLLALAAALAALPLTANSGTRFLIPSLIFASLLIGLALQRLRSRALVWVLVALHALAGWPRLLPYWQPQNFWRIEKAPWRTVLGLESAHEYRYQNVPRYLSTLFLKKSVPPGSRVYSFHGLPAALFPGEIAVSYEATPNTDVAYDFLAAVDENHAPSRSLRMSWETSDLAAIRIEQPATDSRGRWEAADVRLYSRGEDLGGRAAWAIGSDLSPWTADRLIDDDPFSVWRTWTPLRPSAIEIRFPELLAVDEIELRSPRWQNLPQYSLSGLTEAGAWVKIDAQTSVESEDLDPGDLRRRAHRTLRERSYQLVFADVDDGIYQQITRAIDADPAAWGLEELWRLNGERVWRVLEACSASSGPTAD